MKSVVRMLFAGFAVSLMAGCASGVKHSEMASSMPTLKQGEGRVYFMRSASMFGAAVQPDIRLNGEVVGSPSLAASSLWIVRPASTSRRARRKPRRP